MKKRIVSLVAASVLTVGATVGLTACKKTDKGITVWAPSTQQTLVRELVEEFRKQNTDITTNIDVGICGEGEAYANLSKDVTAGADVYGFANDQLMNLKKAGALARLSDTVAEKVRSENVAGSFEAGKIVEGGEDHYYGYPYAADNGFFMYYDSTVVSAEQANKLEDILEACKAQKKYFLFNMSKSGSSWYLGSFFYGAGGDYTIKWTGTTMESAKCDFDQKPEGCDYTYGQIGGRALIDLRAHESFVNADDTVIQSYAASKKIGAVITGTWNAQVLQDSFGEGYAATKMPTYHSELTGKDHQLVPFVGYKLFGVNPNSKHLSEAHRLAAFLSGEQAQTERFKLGIGPSNIKVSQTDAVKNNVALAAFNSQLSFAKTQDSLPSNYWSSLDSFGADVFAKLKYEGLDAKLKSLISGMNG